MVFVAFPRIDTDNSRSIEPLGRARRLIANPKAAAAQTWRLKNVEVAYHESRAWEQIGPLFQIQFRTSGFFINTDAYTGQPEWIAFPWLVCVGASKGSSFMWIEDGNGRRHVRSVRIYPDEAGLSQIFMVKEKFEIIWDSVSGIYEAARCFCLV